MKRIAWLLGLLLFMPAGANSQPAFDAAQAEREVLAVLDAFTTAFNQQDAKAEERTYHFPHYRLANDTMSAWPTPGLDTEAWMEGTYKTLRDSGWDHTVFTRRRLIHLSGAKAHVDVESTRYRKDGTVIVRFDALYILTKEDGRWGITMRSSFDQIVAAPGDKALRSGQRQAA